MLSSLIFKVHCHTKSMIHVITHCQLAYVCGTRLCVMHVRRRNKCWKSCASQKRILREGLMGDQCNFQFPLKNASSGSAEYCYLGGNLQWTNVFPPLDLFSFKWTANPLTQNPSAHANGYKSIYNTTRPSINAYQFDQEPWWALGLIEPIF